MGQSHMVQWPMGKKPQTRLALGSQAASMDDAMARMVAMVPEAKAMDIYEAVGEHGGPRATSEEKPKATA